MQTVGAGPSANSDQKFTAWENERLDWLRPSGRSIFTADVITASTISTANRIGRSRRRCVSARARATAPAITTTVTYPRAFAGSEENVGIVEAAFITHRSRWAMGRGHRRRARPHPERVRTAAGPGDREKRLHHVRVEHRTTPSVIIAIATACGSARRKARSGGERRSRSAMDSARAPAGISSRRR